MKDKLVLGTAMVMAVVLTSVWWWTGTHFRSKPKEVESLFVRTTNVLTVASEISSNQANQQSITLMPYRASVLFNESTIALTMHWTNGGKHRITFYYITPTATNDNVTSRVGQILPPLSRLANTVELFTFASSVVRILDPAKRVEVELSRENCKRALSEGHFMPRDFFGVVSRLPELEWESPAGSSILEMSGMMYTPKEVPIELTPNAVEVLLMAAMAGFDRALNHANKPIPDL